MARKDLLKGLMNPENDPPAPAAEPTRVDTARPRYTTGAIGAVSQSIADLKARAVIEIDPFAIEAGGVQDRLGDDDEDHARLVESLRDHGQQVPILVRPHPDSPDKYQIVYGRRRVMALRSLGRNAKALVRDLDDAALILAQGQENTARRDLSFIEKCNFARQMRDGGYDRKQICAALTVDKTLISRMLSVADRIPVEVIERIGPAPGVGRDRWLAFAEGFADSDADAVDITAMIGALASDRPSDERFAVALSQVSNDAPKPKIRKAPGPRPKLETVTSAHGFAIGRVARKDDAVTVTLPRAGNGGFEEWLAENLTRIHRDWLKTKSGE